MKNLWKLFLALALLTAMALAATALADVTYNGPLPLYANRQTVPVYSEQNAASEVIHILKGAASVLPELVSDDGAWIGILVENTVHGGQMIGWVEAQYISDTFPQSLCTHNWGPWTVESESTCTQKGYGWRLCTICGLRDEVEIKLKDHEWSKWKVSKEATCTKKGERVRACKVCGKQETEEYLDDHDFGAWKMTKEPSCTQKGERVHTCKVCGLEKAQELDTLPHDYEYRITTEATDHSAGVRAKICTVCGKNGGEESFDPEGTIRRKARGEDVRAMQQLLVEQGYLNAGGADGIFGGGTEKALMQYQQDRGLNPDGIAWPQTLKDLQHDFGPWETVVEMSRTQAGERMRVCRGCGFEQHEIVEPGEVFEFNRRGEDVRAMQQMLTELGFNAGSYDGIYGKKLDAAMAGFAEANGMIVEQGKVRPSDVDAVMNAWFDSLNPEDWKGEGSVDSPVNLALTVTPVGGSDAADDRGVHTYNWTLTNLGSQKATFIALLLTFGDDPDFRQNDLVMDLDGFVLKSGAGNDISGSFSADEDWGEGNLNFAALAVTEDDGAKWLSNAVTFENVVHPAEKTIAPMPVDIDVNNLPDGIYPVSFNPGDVYSGASGIFMNAVHIYTQDWYDLVDVSTLKVGDTVIVQGEPVPVLSIEEDGWIAINRDQDAMDFNFATSDDSNGFTVRGLDDLSTYTDHGVTALTVDPAATFTDAWDIESEPVTVTGEDIAEAIRSSENEYFVPYNTTVRVESGRVVEIERVYVP